MKKPILVADVRDADARLSAILAGHELSFVRTLEEAAALLRTRSFELVVIDVHFDDSRMFDLLRHVRSQERLAGVPVVCVRTQRVQWASITAQGLAIAVNALGGQAFVDLAKFGDDPAGDTAVRAVVNELVAS